MQMLFSTAHKDVAELSNEIPNRNMNPEDMNTDQWVEQQHAEAVIAAADVAAHLVILPENVRLISWTLRSSAGESGATRFCVTEDAQLVLCVDAPLLSAGFDQRGLGGLVLGKRRSSPQVSRRTP